MGGRMSVEELGEMLKSPEYKEFEKRLDSLTKKVEKAKEKEQLLECRKELDSISRDLEHSPQLKEIFTVQKKEIAEEIVFRLTGTKVVID